MGLFRKIGKVVEVVVELTDESSEGIGPLRDAPPVAIRPEASSLAVLKALAAQSGGRSGRGIVQWTDGVSAPEDGRDGGSCTVAMIVRAREIDGGFGPRVKKHVLLPRDAGLLIGAGLEVPITRDPATGELTGVDRRALADELRPMFAEARAAENARRNLGVGFAVAAIREGFADLRQSDAEAQPAATVAGVTADQWLQARRVIAMGRIPDAIRDRTLGAYGIPAGRWSEIDAAWSGRAKTDPVLADRLANL